MRALIAPLSVLALLSGLSACSPQAPEFVQVDAPGDTRDAQGDYRITAAVQGVVDRVVVIVEPATRDADAEEAEPIIAALSDRGDGRFEGEIPGVRPGERVTLTLRAEGPGGEAIWPADDAHVFRVFDASGVCIVDGDCLDGEMCDRARERCVERSLDCANSGVCPLDYECDAERGECRFRRTACEGDADCGRGRVCEDGLCIARPECRDDDECPDDSRCVTPPGRCVGADECTSALECPADRPVCADGQCVADDACLEGCPPNSECVGGQCIMTGACGEDCAPGSFCSPILERCVQCTADGHCGRGRSCHDERCVDGLRGANCTPCGADGVCGVGFVCDLESGGLCAQACDQRGDCPDGYFCDGRVCRSEQVCSGFECFNDDDCPGACLAGVCDAPQYCASDDDCADSWTCRGDTCVPRARACSSPFDCEGGEICVGGRCEVEAVAGECRPCEEPADCASSALCGDVDGTGLRCLSICGPDGCADGLECNDFGGIGLCLPFDGVCPEGDCGQDAFEDAEPLRLPPDERVRRTVCNRDTDEFALTVRGTLRLEPNGPVRVELLNLQTGRADREELQAGEAYFYEIGDATIALSVTTDSPFDVDYTTAIQTGPPPMCDDDILEQNDEPDTATIIGDGADINPTVCDGDDDWFRLRIEEGQQATVVISVREAQRVPLQYRVRDGTAQVLAEGEIFEGANELRVVGQRSGLFLQVRCEGCTGLQYNIRTRFDGGGAECPDDVFEPNDSADDATRLPIGEDQSGLFVCDGDEDFFTFAVPARTRVRIDLTFRHGDGDIDTELLQDGQQIDASTSGTDNEQIDLPVSRRNAVYVLRVFLFPSTPRNSYRLRLQER